MSGRICKFLKVARALQSCALQAVLAKHERCLSEFASFCELCCASCAVLVVLEELCFAKVNDSTAILARFVICRAVLCELCLPKVKDVWANLRVFASCEALPEAADLKFLQDVSNKMQISAGPRPQARRPVQGARGGWGGITC